MSSASANCFMTTHHSRRRRFCAPERESFALSRQIADFSALPKNRTNLRYGHYESITIRRRTSVHRRDGIFLNVSELIFSRRGFGKLFAAFLRNKAEKFRVAQKRRRRYRTASDGDRELSDLAQPYDRDNAEKRKREDAAVSYRIYLYDDREENIQKRKHEPDRRDRYQRDHHTESR